VLRNRRGAVVKIGTSVYLSLLVSTFMACAGPGPREEQPTFEPRTLEDGSEIKLQVSGESPEQGSEEEIGLLASELVYGSNVPCNPSTVRLQLLRSTFASGLLSGCNPVNAQVNGYQHTYYYGTQCRQSVSGKRYYFEIGPLDPGMLSLQVYAWLETGIGTNVYMFYGPGYLNPGRGACTCGQANACVVNWPAL
jgi:hypothetical protein